LLVPPRLVQPESGAEQLAGGMPDRIRAPGGKNRRHDSVPQEDNPECYSAQTVQADQPAAGRTSAAAEGANGPPGAASAAAAGRWTPRRRRTRWKEPAPTSGQELKTLVERLGADSITPLIMQLIDQKRLSRKEAAEIRKLLEKYSK